MHLEYLMQRRMTMSFTALRLALHSRYPIRRWKAWRFTRSGCIWKLIILLGTSTSSAISRDPHIRSERKAACANPLFFLMRSLLSSSTTHAWPWIRSLVPTVRSDVLTPSVLLDMSFTLCVQHRNETLLPFALPRADECVEIDVWTNGVWWETFLVVCAWACESVGVESDTLFLHQL